MECTSASINASIGPRSAATLLSLRKSPGGSEAALLSPLKAIFRKTGAKSQAGLVALLTRIDI